jgi:dynactin complex subunit
MNIVQNGNKNKKEKLSKLISKKKLIKKKSYLSKNTFAVLKARDLLHIFFLHAHISAVSVFLP